jgi:hypothetical protein
MTIEDNSLLSVSLKKLRATMKKLQEETVGLKVMAKLTDVQIKNLGNVMSTVRVTPIFKPHFSLVKQTISEKPILAKKIAKLMCHNSEILFRPWAIAQTYGIDSQYVCVGNTTKTHRSIKDFYDCHCGFYALKSELFEDLKNKSLPGAYIELDVELSGNIVKATKGYRAEHQKVLGIRLYPFCSCGRSTEGLYLNNANTYNGATLASNYKAYCLDCVIEHQKQSGAGSKNQPYLFVTPVKLEELLGVPVGWSNAENNTQGANSAVE